MELMFADMDVIEKRLPKIEKKAQFKTDKESVIEYSALMKIKEVLENGKMAKEAELTDEETLMVKNFCFLTMKPMIYVLNVNEDEIHEENEYVKQVKEYAAAHGCKSVVISAKLEEELSQLEDEEKEMFLEELGLQESGLDRLVAEAYSLLGLETFFTEGEKECRAWTFKKGMKAPECAGVIHTDFEKGFIKAEVVSYEDFIQYGSWAKVREAGKLRLEGKDYVFKDGDITVFRFNVSK